MSQSIEEKQVEISKLTEVIREKNKRFNVGDKILFIYIEFFKMIHFGSLAGNYDSEICTDANKFNPCEDAIRDIKGKVLTVKEHHKVFYEFDDKSKEPEYDGFVLVDGDGNLWKNQMPYASYTQTSNDADWLCDNSSSLKLNAEETYDVREGYEWPWDTMCHCGVLLDRCSIREERLLLVSEEVKEKINKFKDSLIKIIDESDYKVIITYFGKSRFPITKIVPKDYVIEEDPSKTVVGVSTKIIPEGGYKPEELVVSPRNE